MYASWGSELSICATNLLYSAAAAVRAVLALGRPRTCCAVDHHRRGDDDPQRVDDASHHGDNTEPEVDQGARCARFWAAGARRPVLPVLGA